MRKSSAEMENFMKKPELLAPAGSYESFLGAVHAGADAVYIGGKKFGARAYADNFSQEEIIRAVRFAHLFGRKVYLTVNTLMKPIEMEELYEYLLPLYESGLDAVIVQDFGVVGLVRERFADMELHISTQMTVTGEHGAGLMKQWGASRIVPARELSLQEVRRIKETVDIEVETFVHGALCYCYSGQCLFSSILGGRSGNRGRCAQPCRLPYGRDNAYPLSLKDMCTIEMLPELMEAGIDSFKIEGRMKKPEYAAGVTAIYRKYIDRYMEKPEKEYQVEKEDLDCLKGLYLRSELQDGYYKRHNGREMITAGQPGYAGSQEALLHKIKETHLSQQLQLPVLGSLLLQKGQPAQLSLNAQGKIVTVTGAVAVPAQKQPLDRTTVAKQLKKTGNTPFSMDSLAIRMEDDVFLPVSALNELRRKALEQLEEMLIPQQDRQAVLPAMPQKPLRSTQPPKLYAAAASLEQGLVLLTVDGIDRIYLPADCLLADTDAGNGYHTHQIAQEKLTAWKRAVRQKKQKHPEFGCFLSLPVILRERDKAYLETIRALLQEPETDGVLTGSLEGYAWLRENRQEQMIVLDANLYLWNEEAAAFFCREAEPGIERTEFTLPVEGDRRQLRTLAAADWEMIVYGRSVMMVSANCIRKTCGKCLLSTGLSPEKVGFYELTDRYRKKFPVSTQCRHCYNIIYNSLPTSLHREISQIKEWGLGALRLQFTTENAEETGRIARWYAAALQGKKEDGEMPFIQTTRGHFKNGVE